MIPQDPRVTRFQVHRSLVQALRQDSLEAASAAFRQQKADSFLTQLHILCQ